MPKNEPNAFTMDYHFRGRRSDMRPVYDKLIAEFKKQCEFEFQVGKTYIGLKRELVFAGLYVQTKKIVVEFVARREFKHSRIRKVIQFAPKPRELHYLLDYYRDDSSWEPRESGDLEHGRHPDQRGAETPPTENRRANDKSRIESGGVPSEPLPSGTKE